MKLRFNLGAVVELSLLPDPSKQKISGKVISVTPDEIEVCPQLRVYSASNSYGRLDTTISADTNYTIHIRRVLIAYWRYVDVLSLQDNGSIGSHSFLLPHSSSELTLENCTINHYSSDGFCKGNGEYCGEIEESGSTMIITTSQRNDDVDDSGLEATLY